MYCLSLVLGGRFRRVPAGAALLALYCLAAGAFAGTPTACLLPENAAGTADFPPNPCAYVSLAPLLVTDGLPPGASLGCDAVLASFFDITYTPGGALGGHVQQFQGRLGLDVSGTGSLTGYHRPAFFDVFCEVNEETRPPNPNIQVFDTEMFVLQGQLPPGDPDFDLLRITGGTSLGLPGPGRTTLTRAGDATWAVDSFFDITYRIDFIGHPGGPLGGMSGSTTGTVRFQCGTRDPVAVEAGSWGAVKALFR